jgi:GntR family transcriptional regulator
MGWDDGDLVVGAVPLWAQIADRLRDSIKAGAFQVGDDLPSESQLIARFGVSRATARNALNELASEGLVERRSGKGTRVLPAQVELPLNLLASFSEDMIARGLQPCYGEIEVSLDTLHDRAAAALDADPGNQAIRVSRLLLANGTAIAHSASWLSPRIVPPTALAAAQELSSTSLYKWLESEFGVRVTHGTEIIEGGIADAHLAEQLGVPAGSAVLNATRTARTNDAMPIEYVERSYRADRYRYRIELVRP